MWLLNIETRELESFEGRNVPEYAILSHRWMAGEVSFRDVLNNIADSREGYPKIDGFCKQINLDNVPVQYIWVDTCCIDKSNNSELSEAINSMYRWYLQAKVCYAYLADVENGNMAQFQKSAWFRRGWTLQELLAPDRVQFFDKNWKPMGTKGDLSETITQITGIPADALEHFDSRRSPHSVADRMSWASQRQTTREEDSAYSLLGIFGVNMPLLYGEGARAFLRLQEEILKISEDLTIFAWQKFPRLPSSNDYLRDTSIHDFGLFAASPESFDHRERRFRNLLDEQSIVASNSLESTLSGAGLTINLLLIPYRPDIYIAPLCCVYGTAHRGPESRRIVAMFLERTQHTGRYRRIVYNSCAVVIEKPESLNIAMGRRQRVILERVPYHAMARQRRDKYGFNILHIEDDILRLFQVNSQDNVDIIKRKPSYRSLFMECGEVGVAGMVRLSRKKLSPIYFHFGFDFEFNPFCLISRPIHQDPRTQEHKIVLRTTVTHMVPVDCNTGILWIVSQLRSNSQKYNLQQHNVELHLGSWKSNEIQFVGRDCRIGLDLSAVHEHGYVYHVSIGLAHQYYPWATKSDSKTLDVVSMHEVDWFAETWDTH